MDTKQFLDLCFDIYSACNWKLFHHELPFVPIYDSLDYFPASVTKGSLAAYKPGSDKKIIMNIDALNGCGVFRLIDVIFHEMVHAYCDKNGIEDVRVINKKQYHTTEFRDVAEAHGSRPIIHHQVYGYMFSNLSPENLYCLKKFMDIWHY